MKKLQPFLCLFPILICLVMARAEVPVATTPSATPAPAAPDLSPSATPQEIDPAKVVEIHKLLELTGTVKLTRQIMDQIISNFKLQNGDVSSDFWDRFEKEMNLQDLIDKMVPLYAKYYSLDDLKAINAFYQTPVGQRVLATTPQIMHESMQIGQDWGRHLAEQLMTELREEKEKAAATPPAAPAPAPTTH